MKNPFLSMWLGGANSAAGAARGFWTAEMRRQQKADERGGTFASAEEASAIKTREESQPLARICGLANAETLCPVYGVQAGDDGLKGERAAGLRRRRAAQA